MSGMQSRPGTVLRQRDEPDLQRLRAGQENANLRWLFNPNRVGVKLFFVSFVEAEVGTRSSVIVRGDHDLLTSSALEGWSWTEGGGSWVGGTGAHGSQVGVILWRRGYHAKHFGLE